MRVFCACVPSVANRHTTDSSASPQLHGRLRWGSQPLETAITDMAWRNVEGLFPAVDVEDLMRTPPPAHNGQLPPSSILQITSSGTPAIPGESVECLLAESTTTHVPPHYTSKWSEVSHREEWVVEITPSEPAHLVRYGLRSADDPPASDPIRWSLFGIDAEGQRCKLHSMNRDPGQDAVPVWTGRCNV